MYIPDPSHTSLGPSVRVHTVTSPRGGVFAIFVDGFNTTSTIDTFSSDSTLPLCYPFQFPPFISAPRDLASRNNHSITLMYVGSSPNAPNGSISEVQFDTFAIPDIPQTAATNSGYGVRRIGLVFPLVLIISAYCVCLI